MEEKDNASSGINLPNIEDVSTVGIWSTGADGKKSSEYYFFHYFFKDTPYEQGYEANVIQANQAKIGHIKWNFLDPRDPDYNQPSLKAYKKALQFVITTFNTNSGILKKEYAGRIQRKAREVLELREKHYKDNPDPTHGDIIKLWKVLEKASYKMKP